MPKAEAYGELDLGSAGPAGTDAPLPEVPDLVLPTRARPAPAAKPPPPVAREAATAATSQPGATPDERALPAGPSFDDGLDMFGDGAPIALDLASVPPGPSAPAPEPVQAPSPRPAAPAPAGDARQPLGAPAPQPSALLQSEDGGRAAAVALAEHGPAPSAWWKAPLYAYRVTMRRMELRRALATCRADLEKAQAAADDGLVAIAGRGRAAASRVDAHAKLVGAVQSADAALRERDSALAAATDAHQRQVAAINERIAAIEVELTAARVEERSHADVLAKAEAVEAKLKRAEIELRNAAVRADASSARKPSRDARQAESEQSLADASLGLRAALERDARQADLQQAAPAVTDATQRLATARRKLAAVEQRILAAKNERAACEDQFRRRGAAHGAEVAKAQQRVRTAMVALGRAIVNDPTNFGANWTEARKDIRALDKATAVRDDDVLLHVMALDAHDQKAVQTGVAIAVALLGLLLALAIVPIILGSTSSAKTRPATPPAGAEAPE
jgi:hypothetical protein